MGPWGLETRTPSAAGRGIGRRPQGKAAGNRQVGPAAVSSYLTAERSIVQISSKMRWHRSNGHSRGERNGTIFFVRVVGQKRWSHFFHRVAFCCGADGAIRC